MLILRPLAYAYREIIANRRRQIPFWVLAGFLPTYMIARWLTSTFPQFFFHIHGVHVHHFTYGIIVLAIVGFVSLVWQSPSRRVLALFYGIGLALSFDEFGMWVRLTDNYNIDQSEDVMVGILAFLVIATYGVGLFSLAWPLMRRTIHR
ncbi:MAG TPA: hypothetical protein VLF67_05270 [Candidatus Saccharimonas sp.]|nr:hypothetical protein [Candidatus Saccharimonas sp.]